jgi:hypothetical protein
MDKSKSIKVFRFKIALSTVRILAPVATTTTSAFAIPDVTLNNLLQLSLVFLLISPLYLSFC